MQKEMNKPKPRVKQRDDLASIVAEIHGVTPRYVRMVRNGERENEDILTTLVELRQGKNKLIEAVKQLVPFN